MANRSNIQDIFLPFLSHSDSSKALSFYSSSKVTPVGEPVASCPRDKLVDIEVAAHVSFIDLFSIFPFLLFFLALTVLSHHYGEQNFATLNINMSFSILIVCSHYFSTDFYF